MTARSLSARRLLRRLAPALALGWRRLKGDCSGLAMIEFAYSLPLLTIAGLYGAELANYATVKTRISQTAMEVADNASRIGENGVLQNIKIYESDINDLFTGAVYSDKDLGFAANGRIILSSLTQNSDGGQWIQWQRCAGSLSYNSSYGTAGDGATGTGFTGMGPSGNKITAAPDTAVMFVEIAYRYQPLFTNAWVPGPTLMTSIAAFNVRDDRDLTQVYQQTGVTPSSCS